MRPRIAHSGRAVSTVRRKEFFRIPIADLASATDLEGTGIEACDAVDATRLGKNAVPETIDAFANASNRADSGDDRAPLAHAVTLAAIVSTYAFIQRNVLLAMLLMKKSPMILSASGARTFTRNLRSCAIFTSTPCGVSSNVQITRIPLVSAFR